MSAIPTPTAEKHSIEVENLKWQLEYERKLNTEVNNLLEDKVSQLMATKEQQKKQLEQLQKTIDKLNEEKAELNSKVLKLDIVIVSLNGKIVDLKNEIDDLNVKEGPMSVIQMDKV